MPGLIPGWFDTYQTGGGSSFPHQVTAGNDIAGGDLVVVVMSWFDNAGAGATVTSVSDGTANSYSIYGTYTRSGSISGGQINSAIFICDSAANPVTQPTFTVTLSASQTGGIGIGYLKYTNQNATPREQIGGGQTADVATSVTGSSMTTSVVNELVIACVSEDISGASRTTPTLTGSTPDVNYIARSNCANNSTSQDLLVVDRGSSTDPNGRISSGTSVAPRFNSGSNQYWVTNDFLLAPVTVVQTAVPITLVANPGLWTDDLGASTAAALIAAVTGAGGRSLRSPLYPVNAAIRFTLGTLAAPQAGTRTLSTNAYKDAAGGTLDLTVKLYDTGGGTPLYTFSGGSLSNLDETLSQIDLTSWSSPDPSNWGAIDIELVANQSAP